MAVACLIAGFGGVMTETLEVWFEQRQGEVFEARDSFEQMAKPVRCLLLCTQGLAVGLQVRCVGAGQPVWQLLGDQGVD